MPIQNIIKEKIVIIRQFAKFFVVGVLNTLLDLGILNLLIFISGISAGVGYSLFKAISFVVANLNSYIWNKRWTFKAAKGGFGQFFVISLIGLLINVGAASLVVNFVGPQLQFSPKVWANIGALFGSAAGLIWNFIGYKFIVFK